MSALDGSIVNMTLPKISTTLNVTTSSIQLVATSYLIVGAVSWKFIILLNVPIGIIALFYSIKLLSKGKLGIL
jgi:hypothetical protein